MPYLLRIIFVRPFSQQTILGVFIVGLFLLAGCGGGSGAGTSASGNSVTEVIGPEGGMLVLPDGSTVTIPPGALSENVSVTFESKTGSTVSFNKSAVEILGKTLHVTLSPLIAKVSSAIKKGLKFSGGIIIWVKFPISSTHDLIKNTSCRIDFLDSQNVKIASNHSQAIIDLSGGVQCLVPIPSPIPVEFNTVEVNLLSYNKYISKKVTSLKPALIRETSDNELKIGCPIQGQDVKIPLILIHGWDDKIETATDLILENPELGWDNLVNFLTGPTQCLNSDYEIFRFKYISTNSIKSNGALLAKKINAEPTLKDRTDIVMIGWSMGGLVARSYIRGHDGANKVHKLITLGHAASRVSWPVTGNKSRRLL